MPCGSVVSYGNYFSIPQPVNINVGHVFLGLSATGLVWYEKLRNVRDQLISPHIPNIAPPSEHFYMKLG
jgi:hypothetical protein